MGHVKAIRGKEYVDGTLMEIVAGWKTMDETAGWRDVLSASPFGG